ncbi:MAG: hypothetical protein EZS28_045276, partial [Streblomastix strix]
MLQNSSNNVNFIQFPSFQPVDLLSCIQFTTASGTFSGPFVQSIDYSPFNIGNFIPQNTKEALLKCAELLKGKDMRNKLEKKELNQWNTFFPYDKAGQILRRLLRISEEIKQQQFQTEWLLDPDSDTQTLKFELCRFPGLGIAYQKRNKPFGYRIANLLDCYLIEDNEAQIARSVINSILQTSFKSRSILDQYGLDKPILLSIKEYVTRLFGDEKVPLETTPLIDVQTALACLVLKKLEDEKTKEQIDIFQRNSQNRTLLIISLQDLLIDIQKCMEEAEKTQWIRDAGQKLIDKAQNNMHDALEVAMNIKLEWSGWFSNGFLRLKCLCDDDRLDG